MKDILSILAVLLLSFAASAQVYEIAQETVCWNTPAGQDSTLNRNILLSNLDNTPPKVLGYTNANAASVAVTGGSVSLGCCCDGNGSGDAGMDDQILTLVGDNLSIEDGNSVDLSAVGLNGLFSPINQNGTIGVTDFTLLDNTNITIPDKKSFNLYNPIYQGVGGNIFTALPGPNDHVILIGDYENNGSGFRVEINSGNPFAPNDVKDDKFTIGSSSNHYELPIRSPNFYGLNSGGPFVMAVSPLGTYSSTVNGGWLDISTLSGGGSDDQELTLTGTTLAIESGNSVDLSGLGGGGGSDDQTLTLTGTTLAIESGNSVDLSGLGINHNGLFDATNQDQDLAVSNVNTFGLQFDDQTNTSSYVEIVTNTTGSSPIADSGLLESGITTPNGFVGTSNNGNFEVAGANEVVITAVSGTRIKSGDNEVVVSAAGIDLTTGISSYISTSLPSYGTTSDAAGDSSLPTGAFFRISNGDGTSQVHIKE